MKAKLKKDKNIQIIPETRDELIELQQIWGKCSFTKSGFSIHADGKTQHSIDNSNFQIKLHVTGKIWTEGEWKC